jgi:hypothetical protein
MYSFLLLATTTLVTSNYSSLLGTGSDQFCRVGDCSESVFYYQAFIFIVSTTGSYSFQSNSSMNTIGYIYSNSFNLANPSQNLLASTNDGAENGQFRFYLFLDASTKYFLIVTTNKPNVAGPFSVNVTGWKGVYGSTVTASGKNSSFLALI